MSEHFLKSIEALEAKLKRQQEEAERAMNKTKSTINSLCEEAGLDPRYEINEGSSSIDSGDAQRGRNIDSRIKVDEFFSKPLSTCIRQVLELRKSFSDGPTDVKEIYRLLKLGGYKFNTSDDSNNMTGLWVSISKNSSLFVKLPSGLIGLNDWYPNLPKKYRTKDRNGVTEAEDQPTNEQQEQAVEQSPES